MAQSPPHQKLSSLTRYQIALKRSVCPPSRPCHNLNPKSPRNSVVLVTVLTDNLPENGSFLLVLDSPHRENEGDLIIAAQHLTPQAAAFMIAHSSGYLCVPLSPSRAKTLHLPPMIAPDANADPNRTAYTITVDAAAGVTTGISATDRSRTAAVLADPSATPGDLRRPGHVVPLIARHGGVRERRGHTEAGWELARLAGFEPPVAVIGEVSDALGEVVLQDGGVAGRPGYVATGMMRAAECVEFGRKFGIRVCTIEDLVEYVEGIEGPLKR